MALSIFSPVANWASSVVYSKYTIVKYLGKTYYALTDHTSGGLFETAKWGGYITDPFGSVISNEDSTDSTRPHFFFTPSYGNAVNNEPRTKITQFGEGYQQRIPESINNTLLKISVIFENRTAKEATAILHFLNARNGSEAFLYTPPEPYATMKLFSCFNWSQQSQFLNNININAEFTEVPV
jgi:phage-related protein